MRIKLILLILLPALHGLENFGVRTELNANWQETSILAEIVEYLVVENEQYFWKFIEELEGISAPIITSKEQYEVGVSIAERLLPPSKHGLFRLAMSLRVMSPRVEAQRRLALTSGMKHGYFYDNGEAGTRIKVEDFGSGIETFEFDHIYPTKSNASKTLIIYGSLSSQSMLRKVSEAKTIVDSIPDSRMIVRHFERKSANEQLVSLSGYGVELALKNTEYKAVDSNAEDEHSDLHGINFKVLHQKHTHLRKELDSLRDNLEKIGEIVPLKSWQLNGLGLRACQKIYSEEDLEMSEKMIQDFPLHARMVSHTELEDSFATSVKENQKKLEMKGVEIGQNVLAINGRIVATTKDQHIDIFSLLNTVKQEQDAVAVMTRIGFPPGADMSRVLSSVDLSPVDSASFAFDYRETLPVYLNELETSFARFKSLHFMLQPFPPGKIRPISRNIFNVILLSDPFDSNDKLFEKVKDHINAETYIRFGIVPVFDEKKHGMSIEKAVETKKVSYEKKPLWHSREQLLNALRRGNRFLKSIGRIYDPLVLLNGYPLDIDADSFDDVLTAAIGVQTIRLQMALYKEEVEDNEIIADWWLKKENNGDIVERANQRITDAFKEKKFVDFKKIVELKYFSESKIIQKNTPVTTWIVADFNNEPSRKLTVDILNSIGKNERIALVPNHKAPCVPDAPTLNLEKIVDVKQLISELASGKLVCSESRVRLVEKGEMAIVSNGMIIGPLDRSEFTPEDMVFLNKLWTEKRAAETSVLLNELIGEDVSVKFYSTMAEIQRHGVKRIDFSEFTEHNKKNSVVFPPSDAASPSISVTWVANPLSREAQQIVSLVKLIHKSTNARIEVIFNPQHAISEMPVKRFYRFVATEQLEFRSDGSVEKHAALFSNLPQKQLLTMSVQTNEAWMIEVKKAAHDLDNIMLESMGHVEGLFQLEHILVEGQARTRSGAPAHGLQIELDSGEKVHDTIVMMNLGYFQLKADPGVWNLRLRNGPSTEKHRIVQGELRLMVDSFTGKWSKIVVEEQETTEAKEDSPIGNFVDSAKNFFSFGEPKEEVINVFTLASGHLYERFLRIMMVSVMKNTETKKVKFWMLKNYLSPKFKESISDLAKHYGFEYELVEYKWPTWLHQQTEKQRVMWGYKILFLDVLFPLSLDKIIFVDADQVVRADLQELMNLNLNGAPYGYAPFCESRSEMDGFRFWKSGYWEQHLMGRRYHISALYVVDLKKFRELFAGDRLRARYALLSSDPNSLSNLDQDLPNNMIHEVPIKTLPQEWLWCETWCDDKSKKKAKTIDLCNNPRTKEPKLSSARRIIGEWKELDEEITDVLNEARVQSESRIKTEL